MKPQALPGAAARLVAALRAVDDKRPPALCQAKMEALRRALAEQAYLQARQEVSR